MTKLEELKAARAAAYDAYEDAWFAYADAAYAAACDAAYAAYAAARDAYQAELNKGDKLMTQDKLQAILAEHKEWLRGNTKGRRADLRGANLRGADPRWC